MGAMRETNWHHRLVRSINNKNSRAAFACQFIMCEAFFSFLLSVLAYCVRVWVFFSSFKYFCECLGREGGEDWNVLSKENVSDTKVLD